MPGPVGHAGVVAAVERLDQVLCVRGVFWRSGGVIDGDDGVVFAGLDSAGYGTVISVVDDRVANEVVDGESEITGTCRDGR